MDVCFSPRFGHRSRPEPRQLCANMGLLHYWFLELRLGQENAVVAAIAGNGRGWYRRQAAQAAMVAHRLMLNAIEASRTCALALMSPT